MKIKKSFLILPVLLLAACEGDSEKSPEPSEQVSDSKVPPSVPVPENPPPKKPAEYVKGKFPKEKYTYFFDAKFEGGDLDGQTLRGEIGKGGNQGSILNAGSGESGFGNISYSVKKFVSSPYWGSLNLFFLGEPALGGMETVYDRNRTKETGAKGYLKLNPAGPDATAKKYVFIFKEVDLDFTKFYEWEPFPGSNTPALEYRNVRGSATISEYQQEVITPSDPEVTSPAAKIQISFLTMQIREK